MNYNCEERARCGSIGIPLRIPPNKETVLDIHGLIAVLVVECTVYGTDRVYELAVT